MSPKRTSLSSISTRLDYGLTASASEKDTGHKLLRITDIREGTIQWDDVPFCQCSREDAQKYELQIGDIVFARTGSVGNSCLIRQVPYGAVFASYLIRIRPNITIVDPVFLSYFFRTPDYWRQVMGAASGAIQVGLNATKLKELKVPLPSLPEQQRIAGILAYADRLRQLRRLALDLSDGYLQSVFLEMFGDSKNSRRVQFGDLLQEDPKNGLYLPAEKYGRGIPIIRITDFYDGVLSSPHQFKRVQAEPERVKEFGVSNGDILINRVNSLEYLGKCALVQGIVEPTLFESNMMRIRLDPKSVLPVYLVKFLTTQKAHAQILQRARKAVNQASINQGDVKSLVVCLPSLSLQQRFAAVVERYERLQAQLREAHRQAEHLFQTLLNDAFNRRP